MAAIEIDVEDDLAAPRTARIGIYAWYVAGLLSVAHLVSFIDRFVMSLVIEPLRQTFALGDTQIGLLQGIAFSLLYAVAGIPLGRLADLRSRRGLIACGLTVWSIATAACAFASSFGGLFGARLLVGVGEAALVPSAISLLSAYFARDRIGRAISIFTMGASLGKTFALVGGAALLAILTPMGLTLLGHHLQPWQGVFLAAAMIGLLLVPLIFTIAEPARQTRAAAPRLKQALAHMRRNLGAFGPHITAACASILLIQAFGAWSPAYFARVRGFSVVEAGYVVGVAALLAGPAGHIFGGWMTDRLTGRGVTGPALTVMLGGMAAAVPCALLLVTLPDGIGPVAAFAALMFVISTTAGPCLAGLQAMTPAAHRGAVISVYMCIITFMSVGLGPAIVGFASEHLASGTGSLGTALAGVTLVVAAFGIAAALLGRGASTRTAAAVLA